MKLYPVNNVYRFVMQVKNGTLSAYFYLDYYLVYNCVAIVQFQLLVLKIWHKLAFLQWASTVQWLLKKGGG